MERSQRQKDDAFGSRDELQQPRPAVDPARGVEEIKSEARIYQAVAYIEQVVGAVAQRFVGALAEEEYFAVAVKVPAHHQYRDEADAEVNDIGEDLVHG